MSNVGKGTTGTILQGAGTGSSPSFSTATYPSIATGTGTILRADGTNWAATTSTYPNTNAVSTLLYASSANVMGALATANSSMLVTSSSGVPSLATTLAGSFSFAVSSSGANVTTTTSNTSNTASSNALQQVTVAGTSAGDAFTTYTVTGTTNWSVGTDNSVTGDPFVISASTALGTTNIMSALTSGEITYPLQPAFLGYLGSTALNKTGNGTTYTIGTDALTEVYDQNSDFTTGGLFTAPVTGKYYLGCGVSLTGITIATQCQLTLITSNLSYKCFTGRSATAQDISANISVLADFDAADTMTATVLGAGEAADTDDVQGATPYRTFLSGYLAC